MMWLLFGTNVIMQHQWKNPYTVLGTERRTEKILERLLEEGFELIETEMLYPWCIGKVAN